MYRRYDKMLGCGAKKSSNDGDTAEAENRGGVWYDKATGATDDA